MLIQHCEFPDDLLYDVENDIWIRQSASESWLGITSVLSAVAGKIKTIHLQRDLRFVKRGQLIGTIESEKFHGAIRSPLDGEIIELNFQVEKEPRLVNHSPYTDGWIAKIKRIQDASLPPILNAKDGAEKLEAKINELHVRCFKKIPDDELIEVGSECAATLVNLGDLLKGKRSGDVVHLVSDDPLASIELGRWAELTKNEIIETRDEGNLHHFLIEKK